MLVPGDSALSPLLLLLIAAETLLGVEIMAEEDVDDDEVLLATDCM